MGYDPDYIPDQEIKSSILLSGTCICEAIHKRLNGNINTYLLTFGMPTLLTNVKVGLHQTKINMLIPNPLRCFKCQRFGHGQSTRKGSKTCFKCDEVRRGMTAQATKRTLNI